MFTVRDVALEKSKVTLRLIDPQGQVKQPFFTGTMDAAQCLTFLHHPFFYIGKHNQCQSINEKGGNRNGCI